MPKKDRQATRTTPGFTGPFKGDAQQGTLFDVRTMPKTGEEIGPRGYSQNRSKQFNDIIQKKPGFSMQPGQVAFGVKYRGLEPDEMPGQAASVRQHSTPAVEPDQHPFGPANLHATPAWGERPSSELATSLQRGRSKLIDTLARSTVQPKHLQGLNRIDIHPEDPAQAGSYHGGEHHASTSIKLNVTRGSQQEVPGDMPFRTKQPQQRGPVDPDSELTLLHEIGHHVSATAGTEHSAYDTPSKQAREEGYADRFAIQHFRQDTRGVGWGGQTDPREHTYEARGLEHARWGGGSVAEAGYRHMLGRENQPPAPYRPMSEQVESEAVHRPMLDEPQVERGHESVFPGYGRPGDPRDKAYRGAIRRRNRATRIPAQKAERKARWGVNRNLGAQF